MARTKTNAEYDCFNRIHKAETHPIKRPCRTS